VNASRERPRRLPAGLRKPLVALDHVEALVHYVIVCLLLAIAIIVIYRTVERLIASRHEFTLQVTNGINDVLFVVIVMELLRTVVGHLATMDFQLRPFLIIGIISAVRHILTVGARLTIAGEGSGPHFARSQIELAVSAGVVLALSLGLLLISRAGVESDDGAA
jgi:uncharacterized membrane protein (DUF373 family)